MQLGFDVRIFLLWTRKLQQLSNSTLPLNATTADTTDFLNHVQVSISLMTVLYQHRHLHVDMVRIVWGLIA